MAHYAILDENNIVIQVIVGRDENDIVEGVSSWEDVYSDATGKKCKRTSYNTFGNKHLQGGTPFRGNYACIGFKYHEDLDAFISPQPFYSWTLNEGTFLWEAPVEYPNDGQVYKWDEETTNWVLIEE